METYGPNEIISENKLNMRASLSSKIVAVSDIQALSLSQSTYENLIYVINRINKIIVSKEKDSRGDSRVLESRVYVV